MAKITDLTALTAPVGTDYMVIVDESTGVTKKMELDYLLVALDGDHLDIDFTPTYYTPATTPAEAADADDLAAHLYGIDQALLGIPYKSCTESTTFTATQKYIDVNTSGGAVTGTLPSAATNGAGYNYIFKISDATNAFTLATNGAETIDGADAWGMTNLEEVLEIISDGTNWKVLRWDLPRPIRRAQFEWATGTSFTVGTFTYDTPGMDYPKVYIKAAVTVSMQSGGGGSNASNSDVDTTGWHYLYIDASAVDTQNTPLIDTDCLLTSVTAPTWDSSYGIWVNGSDICIFAFNITTAGAIDEFFINRNTGHVTWADGFEVLAQQDVDTVWIDVTLKCPDMGADRIASVTFFRDPVQNVTAAASYLWRKNGQTGATGHVMLTVAQSAGSYLGGAENTQEVVADSTCKIEVRCDTTALADYMGVWQDGYYLPRGL